MEAQNDMVLDSKLGVLHGIKRKRAVQHATVFPGASHVIIPQPSLGLSPQKHGKRRRLNDCRGKSGRSLLLCYSNFKKTGIPQRIMFFENDGWTDFPHDLIALIKKDLDAKQPFIEVEIGGQSFVLDLLHMFRLDRKTGCKQPIAWIDEVGRCFFPETFADEDGPYDCCEHDCESDQESMFSKSYAPQEIKLQLEIDINGVQQSKLKECSGESSSFVRQVPIAQNPATSHCAVEVEDSCKRIVEARPCESLEDIQQKENKFLDVEFDSQLDSSTVEQMFLMGMNPCGGVDVLDIKPCAGASAQYRLERFQKQVQIMKKYRGNANVQYAWLASSKKALPTIGMHGLGHSGLSTIPQIYGAGVHLAASKFTNARLEIFFMVSELMLLHDYSSVIIF
ncbi:hypothetical protein CCACVL1_15042 [Corchorus capsularis]|uniref:RCD1 WWE domain-containing protein n=1 Tax=Corchorus capsularis TaxID=210143 RepID=A0A1R3I455_COCAP|nr:hypothetical protein CCACVL1_15042 [Corchorus capsularis]